MVDEIGVRLRSCVDRSPQATARLADTGARSVLARIARKQPQPGLLLQGTHSHEFIEQVSRAVGNDLAINRSIGDQAAQEEQPRQQRVDSRTHIERLDDLVASLFFNRSLLSSLARTPTRVGTCLVHHNQS